LGIWVRSKIRHSTGRRDNLFFLRGGREHQYRCLQQHSAAIRAHQSLVDLGIFTHVWREQCLKATLLMASCWTTWRDAYVYVGLWATWSLTEENSKLVCINLRHTN
jgi:hypothetical protein